MVEEWLLVKYTFFKNLWLLIKCAIKKKQLIDQYYQEDYVKHFIDKIINDFSEKFVKATYLNVKLMIEK